MKQIAESGLKKQHWKDMFRLLKPYKWWIALLVAFALISNAVNLIIPQIISRSIDSYTNGNYEMKLVLMQFLGAIGVIFLFAFLQALVRTYTSEKVGLDLRNKLSEKISQQSYVFIQETNPSKLLTNLTSDVDGIKTFIAQGVSTIFSSFFVIIGAAAFLLTMNLRLALPVLLLIPAVSITFFIIHRKVRVLFMRRQGVTDWLNRVITESILGAAIIRVLNSQQIEGQKFIKASSEARNLGISIVTLFATLMPLIIFFGNLAMLTILILGGHFVISDKLTLGEFAAFNSYVSILIFPIMSMGFVSNMLARASASYERVENVLNSKDTSDEGAIEKELTGSIEVQNASVLYGEKAALKDVSLSIQPGSRTAIIGPTGAGKTQLLYLLTGLIQPNEGEVLYEGVSLKEYKKEYFHGQVGVVFQDSIMFNMTLAENVSFAENVTSESLQKAIETAELDDFIDTLPNGLNTMVSERGTSLSGGQKQRVMLARALALHPKILMLDDFTARVDKKTEKKILKNVRKNYPEITLISVTQKISPIKKFDQVILLMDGELIASGKHDELLKASPEYVQIYESQKSINNYEL